MELNIHAFLKPKYGTFMYHFSVMFNQTFELSISPIWSGEERATAKGS